LSVGSRVDQLLTALLVIAGVAFGLLAYGPMAAADAARDPQAAAVLRLYAAFHGIVGVVIVGGAVIGRRSPTVGAPIAALGTLLAWLVFGFMDALWSGIAILEPASFGALRPLVAAVASLGALAFLMSAAPRRR
jgi:hypothetical protein